MCGGLLFCSKVGIYTVCCQMSETFEYPQVKHIEEKGRGVFAVKRFKKGDFVVEYHGDLLDLTEAKKREAEYSKDPETGCYMYYFQYQSKAYW